MAVTVSVKTCSRCEKAKAEQEFARRSASSDGLSVWCRSCQSDYSKVWREKNGERQNANVRAWHYKTKFGLTPEEYLALVRQGCKVCGETRNIHLDHDHETGAIRDPLCSNCNRALGHAKDSADRLRALADYLDRHRRS